MLTESSDNRFSSSQFWGEPAKYASTESDDLSGLEPPEELLDGEVHERLVDRNSPEYIAEMLALKIIEAAERRRKELKLTYSALAKRMNVSRSYVMKLMSGTQNSSLSSYVKLSIALECKLLAELTI